MADVGYRCRVFFAKQARVEIFYISSLKRGMVVYPYYRNFCFINKFLLDNCNVKNEDFIRSVLLNFLQELLVYFRGCLYYDSLSILFHSVKQQKRGYAVRIIVKKEQWLLAVFQFIAYLRDLFFIQALRVHQARIIAPIFILP